ncbi:MAG: hypothetical protein LBL75_01325 [Rickettsiales bacterium]|jgi:hypothetical protein|nr:hypothetical protein [Rickettsiales bacterium]
MKYIALFSILFLCACNSVYINPNTDAIDPSQTFFTDRGGYSMKRGLKEKLQQRGYNVIVGQATKNRIVDVDSDDFDITALDMDVSDVMNARYIVKVSERKEKFAWYWCPFNGWWWWNFNVSIADQKTGTEIMSWRGRGCANSSMRKLDRILDDLESQK